MAAWSRRIRHALCVELVAAACPRQALESSGGVYGRPPTPHKSGLAMTLQGNKTLEQARTGSFLGARDPGRSEFPQKSMDLGSLAEREFALGTIHRPALLGIGGGSAPKLWEGQGFDQVRAAVRPKMGRAPQPSECDCGRSARSPQQSTDHHDDLSHPACLDVLSTGGVGPCHAAELRRLRRGWLARPRSAFRLLLRRVQVSMLALSARRRTRCATSSAMPSLGFSL